MPFVGVFNSTFRFAILKSSSFQQSQSKCALIQSETEVLDKRAEI